MRHHVTWAGLACCQPAAGLLPLPRLIHEGRWVRLWPRRLPKQRPWRRAPELRALLAGPAPSASRILLQAGWSSLPVDAGSGREPSRCR